MEETNLPEHRTDRAHLEHEPLNGLMTGSTAGRKERASLVGQIKQYGAGLAQSERRTL